MTLIGNPPPGEPERATEGGRALADGAGGRPGEQLGVHGDGVVGVEPEGVERLADAGGPAARGGAPRREARLAADGVRDVPRGGDRDAVPARPERRTADLSPDVVDAVARDVPAPGGAPAGSLVVLRQGR